MARILVVEDDIDLQFLYDTALSRYNHEITSVDSTAAAIVYLTNDEFDLIILDINMPDMPGLKVAEFVRDDVRLKNVPIVIVSAVDQYRTKAQELGVAYFLVKPLALHELMTVVSEVLDKKSGE